MPPKKSQVSKKRKAVSIGGVTRSSKTQRKAASSSSSSPKSTTDLLREEFISLFSKSPYQQNGITNSQLKSTFSGERYVHLVPIINDLTREARLSMSKLDNELVYKLVNEDTAAKFAGLDVQARMVYQIIEESGNKGIWTKDIRFKTKIQQQALTKIFKNLESRKLIKPVKSVNAKSKKCYMLYDLQPSKEITGGPWYTEMEFDYGFISELRTFIMHCIRRLNGGKGVTMKEIAEKMKLANVSRVQLNLQEVQQLIQTLAFDYKIEQNGVNQNEEALFIAAKPVTTPCDFTWWEVLSPDFHFQNIKFEDDVVLSAHEPHYHTAS
jgi:DNA-directed RNA polymerase III subunit RPC6